MFSYVIFGLFGVPTISALRRFGKLNLFSLVFCGATIGAAAIGLFILGFDKLVGWSDPGAFILTACAWGAVQGALVGGSFGAIAGLHNLRANQAGRNPEVLQPPLA